MTTSEVESIPQWPYNSPLWGTIPEFSGRKLQADIIACVSITWLIALVFVILRFYTRGRLIHVLGPSDWCIIPSLVSRLVCLSRDLRAALANGCVLLQDLLRRRHC